MTTPETRARLQHLQAQRRTPTPDPLPGQAVIPLRYEQPALWDTPTPAAGGQWEIEAGP